jgi:protein-S-isoprenylcysteine O-methyltransferase Ste14
MNILHLSLLFAIVSNGASAFSPLPFKYTTLQSLPSQQTSSPYQLKSNASKKPSSVLFETDEPNDSAPKEEDVSVPKQKDAEWEIQKAKVTNFLSKIFDNISSGEFGKRGEAYFAGQIVLVLCVLNGNIPLVGNLMIFLFGPCACILGAVVVGLGVKDLGSNLSPFPNVPENTDLVTDGIFSEVRHPIYTGLLYFCLGISIWSGSAMRMLLTFGLWLLLNKKSDYEEKMLLDKFPSYNDYLIKVKGRFFPEKLMEKMPWAKKD